MTAEITWSARAGWPVAATVEDASQVPGARRLAEQGAREAGLSDAEVDGVSLAATELAENLHRHAQQGILVVDPGTPDSASAGTLSMLALDRGPGVARFARNLRDGVSTGGTLGAGLGAVVRRASHFDVISEVGRGTAVRAVFGAEERDVRRIRFDVGAMGFPVKGETENGDAYFAAQRDARISVILADGLGHGRGAGQASRAAIHQFSTGAHLSPGAALAAVNSEMVASRGTAATVAATRVNDLLEGGVVSTAGLGNVSVLVADPDGTTKRIATEHGTVGLRARSSTTERDHPLAPGALLVLHTDGLHTRWDLSERAELLQHDAQTIAAVLWRDHARTSDDSLVVVVKALPWSTS